MRCIGEGVEVVGVQYLAVALNATNVACQRCGLCGAENRVADGRIVSKESKEIERFAKGKL